MEGLSRVPFFVGLTGADHFRNALVLRSMKNAKRDFPEIVHMYFSICIPNHMLVEELVVRANFWDLLKDNTLIWLSLSLPRDPPQHINVRANG
eukprot:scaffold5773_cov36-Tisochrysis_lutea.AAC.3